MKWPRFIRRAGVLTGLAVCLGMPPIAQGQVDAAQPAPKVLQPSAAGETIKSINEDYDQQLLVLERRRLGRLERLAAEQNPADAAATYEQLFRLAIGANLFRDAEPAALAVLSKGSPSLTATAFAHFVKIIAESDRGAFEQSLESLRQAVADREKAAQSGSPRAELPTGEIVGICDAYFQRLIHDSQYEIARKALQLVLSRTQRPVLKEFLSSRLKRLDQVGKPAPAIQGTDVDGKPFNVADARGKVVLVVFWASWCLPCAAEIESFHHVVDSYRERGFQIVGINLDALQEHAGKLETVLPNIRHFVLDHNVRWPTLINGQGAQDYAKAYGVTEIPANVLIARDGTVSHIDLVPKNLEPIIARAVGE